jgi:dienelactone hydrolase
MKQNFNKRFSLLIALVMSFEQLLAQKPVIDTNVYGKWPNIGMNKFVTKLTNDGNFVTYVIRNRPIGSSTTVICSTRGDWKKELGKVDLGNWPVGFSQDSHRYIFIRNDSLGIGILGKSTVNYTPGIHDFQLFKKGKNNDWLIYRNNGVTNELIITDLVTGIKKSFEDIQNYLFSEKSQSLILQITKNGIQQLYWIDMNTSAMKIIWSGRLSGQVKLDETGTQLAFVGTVPEDNSVRSIFYYKEGAKQAIKLADAHSTGIDDQCDIQGINTFNGAGLCFNLQEKRHVESLKSKTVAVDIYSYSDGQLQSEQLQHVNLRQRYCALINIADRKISILEGNGVKLISTADQVINNHGYVLVVKYDDGRDGPGTDEWNWNSHAKFTVYLQSLKDESLRPIIKNAWIPVFFWNICQSPTGEYVIYYDPLKGNYFSYEIETGVRRNITQFIHSNWAMFDAKEGEDELAFKYLAVGIAGFTNQGKSAVIYDQRDIYQIDLLGSKPGICLTNHYGRKHHIAFRLPNYGNLVNSLPEKGLLIVNAFNYTTKQDGFFRIQTGLQKNPELLAMQPAFFDGIADAEAPLINPVKARDTESYIVQRQNFNEPGNLFWTSDFKNFKRLTDLAPQKAYIWLTSELVTWKTFDGTLSQGILFKPENFDPRKKYPIIFFYYERFSNTLHVFRTPEATGAVIDIPTLVSNGYLVFIPDVHYPLGTGQGPGCYNAVVSAAKYMAKKPWVDASRMGINGHSRGGFETNYLVTHTHLFAAAISGSGYANATSLYTRIRQSGTSGEGAYELTHQRIGGTLWQKQKVYLDNSPVLRADKVVTPLLMMNNKGDDDIPFEQGAQFFNALRRLGKKAWMLQYDGQSHVILNKAAANDFSIRMLQFFDYYLKGALPPFWMTRGVSAKLKGIDNGLALDTSGQVP